MRRRTMQRMMAVRILGLLAAGAAGQDAAAEATAGVLRFEHVEVDREAGRIVVNAEVALREGHLEMLLVPWQTKTHESILHTRARGWEIHAGLLALGLRPGKPVEWIYREDTRETIAIPPRGSRVRVRLRWTDPDSDEVHEVPAGRWMTTTEAGEQEPTSEWVFVGSEVLPDRAYAADVEATLITVANFPSAMLDVPFESTDSDEALEFEARTERIPPVGTPVQVILTPVAATRQTPFARSLLEIDRFGRLLFDGRGVSREELRERAGELVIAHSQARVTVRADALAMVHDVGWVLAELQLAGVHDTQVQRLRAYWEVPPRTADQMDEQLGQWAHRFANPQDYLRDPGQEAARALQEIEQQVRELHARQLLAEEYARRLRAQREAYRNAGSPQDD